MGQKVNPKSFRLGGIYTWDSSWFSEKNYRKFLREDILIKEYLRKKFSSKGVAKIEIKRSGQVVDINIYSSKPGIIIGRGGAGIEELRKDVVNKFFKQEQGKNKIKVNLNIKEIKQPNLSADLVAQSVVVDIEKRMPFRRAIKQAAERVKRAGAKGIKIMVAGRLNGVEIARTEKVVDGNLPLHTIRADIDYSLKEAHTIYGVIGVKVWIYKGDIFNKKENNKK